MQAKCEFAAHAPAKRVDEVRFQTHSQMERNEQKEKLMISFKYYFVAIFTFFGRDSVICATSIPSDMFPLQWVLALFLISQVK